MVWMTGVVWVGRDVDGGGACARMHYAGDSGRVLRAEGGPSVNIAGKPHAGMTDVATIGPWILHISEWSMRMPGRRDGA